MPPRFTADDYYDPGRDGWGSDEEEEAPRPAPRKMPPKAPPPSALGRALAGGGAPAGGGAGARKAAPPPAQRLPAAPPPPPGGPRPFAFDTPSPDEAVAAARAGRVPGSGRGGGPPPPPPAPAAPAPTAAALAALSLASPHATAVPRGGGGGGGGGRAATPPQPQPHAASPQPAMAAPAPPYRPEAWEARPPWRPRSALHCVALGHVDAGKSTALGRLLHDCAAQPPGATAAAAAAAASRRASAASGGAAAAAQPWAWALDTDVEERARGVTRSLAVAPLPIASAVLFDAPGHADFGAAAAAGAALCDAALLFVDASSPRALAAGLRAPGGATREHAALAAASPRCGALVVCVNKLDSDGGGGGGGWGADAFWAAVDAAAPVLAAAGWPAALPPGSGGGGGAGARPVLYVPLSGRDGVNLAAPPPRGHPLEAWWRLHGAAGQHPRLLRGGGGGGPFAAAGLSLLDVLTSLLPRLRAASAASAGGGPMRLPVAECGPGAGKREAVVAGRLWGGAIRAGDRVLLHPLGRAATVTHVAVAVPCCVGDPPAGPGAAAAEGGGAGADADRAAGGRGGAVAYDGDYAEATLALDAAGGGDGAAAAAQLPSLVGCALAHVAHPLQQPPAAAAAGPARLAATLSVLSDHCAAPPLLLPGTPVELLVCSASVGATVESLDSIFLPHSSPAGGEAGGGGERRRPRLLAGGDAGRVTLALGGPLAVEALAPPGGGGGGCGQPASPSPLARLVLRQAGHLLAVGTVDAVLRGGGGGGGDRAGWEGGLGAG